MRVGLWQLPQTSMTLPIGTRLGDVQDAALLDLGHPVGGARGLARLGVPLGDVEPLDDDADAARWRSRAGTCCRPTGAGSRRMTRSTLPVLPASLPASTTTVSPLRISGTLVARVGRGHHSTSGASETIFM